MRLLFDRGTLLFEGVADGADLGFIPGVRFDPRVNRWRARACDREAILHQLVRAGMDVADDTQRALGGPRNLPAFEMRPYQEAALAAWEGAHRRGVVVAPTGSGKTRIAFAAVARTACRTLIIVPTRVLLEQWRDELFAAGFDNVGRYGDGNHEMAAITVATIESAWRWMHTLGDAFELLVIDEVHRVTGEARGEALEMSVAPFRLGLTATLDARDAGRVEKLVGPVVHTSSFDDLAGSYLAPFELVVMPVELNRFERQIYDGHMASWRAWSDDVLYAEPDLSFTELAERARRTPEGRAALDELRRARGVLAYPTQKRVLLGELLDEHRARKVLIFTADNKTAYAVAREHLVAPITCDVKRAERASILERFRSGELRAVVSAQVLNEGVDIPDADVAIVVGGRAGEREHIQRIGRVLRPRPGKQALIVELVVPRSTEVRAGARRRAFMAASRAPPLRGT